MNFFIHSGDHNHRIGGRESFITGIVIKISNKINSKNSKKNVEIITGPKLMSTNKYRIINFKDPNSKCLLEYFNYMWDCKNAREVFWIHYTSVNVKYVTIQM